MSFVLGFVTGMTTGEAVQRRKGHDQFREYLQQRGFSIVDQQGQHVAFDMAMDGTLKPSKKSRVLLFAGAAVVAAAVLTGGTALVLVAIA